MADFLTCKEKKYICVFSSPVLGSLEQGVGFDAFGQDRKEKPVKDTSQKRSWKYPGNARKDPSLVVLTTRQKKTKNITTDSNEINNNESYNTNNLCKLEAYNVKFTFLALLYYDFFGSW